MISLIQDTVHVATTITKDTGILVGLEQVLVVIWTVFSAVMVPLTRHLIKTLKDLDANTTRLTYLVSGVESSTGQVVQRGLTSRVSHLEEDVSVMRHTLGDWMTKLNIAPSLQEAKPFHWKKVPRSEGENEIR